MFLGGLGVKVFFVGFFFGGGGSDHFTWPSCPRYSGTSILGMNLNCLYAGPGDGTRVAMMLSEAATTTPMIGLRCYSIKIVCTKTEKA